MLIGGYSSWAHIRTNFLKAKSTAKCEDRISISLQWLTSDKAFFAKERKTGRSSYRASPLIVNSCIAKPLFGISLLSLSHNQVLPRYLRFEFFFALKRADLFPKYFYLTSCKKIFHRFYRSFVQFLHNNFIKSWSYYYLIINTLCYDYIIPLHLFKKLSQ